MPQSNRIPTSAKNGVRQRVAAAPQEAAAATRDYLEHAIDDQPMTVMCISFAAGLAVGAGLVALLCETQGHWSTEPRSLAERVSDAVMQALPTNWRHTMGS